MIWDISLQSQDCVPDRRNYANRAAVSSTEAEVERENRQRDLIPCLTTQSCDCKFVLLKPTILMGFRKPESEENFLPTPNIRQQ
jgi:hypothetical protein